MNLFKKSLILVFVMCFTIILSGCAKKPDGNIKNFFEATKKSDFDTMSSLMRKEGSKGEFKYEDANQEKIVKDIFSKVSYEIISSKVDGKNATVKTKVTSLDLPRIYGKVISDLMPSLVGAAFSNETGNAEAQLTQSLINAINDPNAVQTTTEVDIKLIKDDKGWLIEPNDDLLNTMTGNLSKAFKDNTSGNSTVVVN